MRKVPQRRCVVCGRQVEKGPASGGLRLVRPVGGAGQGGIGVDTQGKLPGRGAYVCRSGPCRTAFGGEGRVAAATFRKLERALRVTLSPEQRADLARALAAVGDGVM